MHLRHHIPLVRRPPASLESMAGEICSAFNGGSSLLGQKWEEFLANIADGPPQGLKPLSMFMTLNLYPL